MEQSFAINIPVDHDIMYSFLSGLPAVLGLLGFVVFLLLRRFGSGDKTTQRIIEKLRVQHPEKFTGKSRLTSKQIHTLLEADHELQKEVGKQDFELLVQSLRQQHVQAITVYLITAVLFAIGVVLFVFQINKPVPTKVSAIQLESAEPSAKGLLVDLDDLRITWKSSGTANDIKLFLENLDTDKRTVFWTARTSDNNLEIRKGTYQSVISRRAYGDWNRVRIVVQAEEDVFQSSEFKIHVGATIVAIIDSGKVTIAATIDNSLINGYKYEAKLVVPKRNEIDYLSVGSEISGIANFPVDDVSEYDWKNANLVYFGPDDARTIRYSVNYDIN